MSTSLDDVQVAVVGLGYVGLPVALAAAGRYPTVGYDLDTERVAALRRGHDPSDDVGHQELEGSRVVFTSTANLVKLQEANFYVVAVPTPVDAQNRPDLGALRHASREVGAMLRPGDTVVYEATVYPGATEEVCLPLLVEASGLEPSQFNLGYSPERIVPGDPKRQFRTIKKVVSATTLEALDLIAAVYESLVEPGVHRAPSVRVAEACKVIENIQRDVNIGLVNELAVIFDRLGIETSDVLAAAATKWNWLDFHPGLVGGHCIGVDPYYLAAKAEEVGVAPQVIMSGRRVNESMGAFIAQRTVREMALAGVNFAEAEVLILGASFKPGVSDLRNSKAFDVAKELKAHGCKVQFYDPLADDDAVRRAGWPCLTRAEVSAYQPTACVLAVPHPGLDKEARCIAAKPWCRVLVDVCGAVEEPPAAQGVRYWRL